MPWWTRSTGNEMGDYLPDDEATLQEERITVKGKNENEAQENCNQDASEYDAVEAKVEPTGVDDEWLCRFKFWG